MDPLPKTDMIYPAMVAIMQAVDGLTKEKTSQHGNFKYRGIDDTYNYLHDILAEHKVFTVPRVIDMTRDERQSNQGKTLFYTILRMEFDFVTEDGSKVTIGPMMGEAMDSGDKSCNKAMAIAHKYALFQVFMIPTNLSADPDSEIHEVVSKNKPGPGPELADKEDWKMLKDYRQLGATTGAMNDYLDERKNSLTKKQATQMITKIEEGIK